jgi:hypothetical protein
MGWERGIGQIFFLALARYKASKLLLPEQCPKGRPHLPGVDLSRLSEQLGDFPVDQRATPNRQVQQIPLMFTQAYIPRPKSIATIDNAVLLGSLNTQGLDKFDSLF